MKRALNLTLGLAMALVLLTALGVQFISGAPPGREQSAGSAVPRGPGKTIVVTNTTDSGPGTLRQALLDAESGDTITFDPAVFPPNASATISLTSVLPGIGQGNLTIDASNAGVILDGSNILGDYVSGLEANSDGNVIRGLRIVNFSGSGIALSGGAKHNTIGGDRSIGTGPLGQGNLTSNNGNGIGLWGNGTSFNTITGNLVGTDATGTNPLGNHGSGISISQGASYNVIGLDNTVAYNANAGGGIEVRDPDSQGNTITQNSIHDNEREGIYLGDGGNTELSAPSIFDFDLTAGTVTGAACANCTVEVFSDSNDEGDIYEGHTIANGSGVFTFNKGASFTGPHLTATATDADGNTSEFSAPTSGTSTTIVLQEGNNLPKTLIRHKQSKELLDNHMGDFVSLKNFDESAARHYINWITKFGYKWVFLTIDWFDFTEVLETGEYSEFEIRPEQDKVITDLVNNGIKIIYCLVYYEPVDIDIPFSWENLEAYLVKDPNQEGRFRTEGETQHYLDYVRFIVHHFKDRIEYYQILNEPLNGIIGQYVKAEDYINLAKRVVPVIRDECRDCKVVVGSVFGLPDEPGCLPSEPTCHEYLFNILRSDVMPLVDGISFHPSPELSPEHGGDSHYKYYQKTIQEIKDVSAFHGFKGEYITEGPTFAIRPRPPQTFCYSDIVAAKYNSRSVITHLNKNVITSLPLGDGDLKARVTRNLCNIMEGAKPMSLPIETQSPVENLRSYSFSSPNGYLVALWQDDVANEDFEVNCGLATLTFYDFSNLKVVGIDVLNNFKQQMITDSENGNLVIRNLLVKDYPIILRLSSTKYVFLPIVLKGYGR